MKKSDVERAKRENEAAKKEYSVSHLYFSRYTLVRYLVTGLFFTNLLWFFMAIGDSNNLSAIIAGCMLLVEASMMIEHISKLQNHQADMPINRIGLWIQAVLNVVLLLVLFTPMRLTIFEFAKKTPTITILAGILLLGIAICILCEYRLQKINRGEDRYTRLIQLYQKQ